MRRVPAVCAILLLACRETSDLPRASNSHIDTTASGTIVTTNSGPTAWADTSGWRLVYERSLGIDEPEPLLTPRGIVATASGEVVVVERTPPHLVVFGADGTRRRAIGRQGSGPGEFARGGILMVTGDTIVHHDGSLGRVQRFLTDGTLINSWPAPCCIGEPTRADTFGRIAIPAQTRQREAHEVPWAGNGFIRFDGTGRALDTLIPPTRPSSGTWSAPTAGGGRALVQVPLTSGWLHTLSPAGEWVHGYTDALRFAVTDAAGDTLRLIEAQVPDWPVADSVRQRLRDEIVGRNPELAPVAPIDDVPQVYPRWSDLAIDGAGALWILATGATGLGDHWMVFDRDGRWLGRVPAPFRSAVRMYWTADRLYAIVRDGKDGGDEVRVYRIQR